MPLHGYTSAVYTKACISDVLWQRPLDVPCTALAAKADCIDGIVELAILEENKRTSPELFLTNGDVHAVPVSHMTIRCMSEAVRKLCMAAEEIATLDSQQLRLRALQLTVGYGEERPLTASVTNEQEAIAEKICAFRNTFASVHTKYGVPFPDALRIHLLARNLSFAARGWTPPVRVGQGRVGQTDTFTGVFTTRTVNAGEVLTRVPIDVIGITSEQPFVDREPMYDFLEVPNRKHRRRSQAEKAQLTMRAKRHVTVVPDATNKFTPTIPALIFGDPLERAADACGHLVRDACDLLEMRDQVEFFHTSAKMSNAAIAFPATCAAYVVATDTMPAGTEVLATRGLSYWKWQRNDRF